MWFLHRLRVVGWWGGDALLKKKSGGNLRKLALKEFVVFWDSNIYSPAARLARIASLGYLIAKHRLLPLSLVCSYTILQILIVYV